MSEMTISQRILQFTEKAKGAHENPAAVKDAQLFFKREVMGLTDERLLGDTATLSPAEQSTLASRFGDSLARTAQTLTGTEYHTVVTYDHLLGQIKDAGTRHTLEDLGRQFQIG